jgi:Luciferase-like monooxygenase
MLHLFENPIGKSEHDVVYEQLTLMRAAEDYGFDSVWPAEHHFSEYGYCASPALTLAALALETKRLRLGTGVVVLPLNHPLRVAEGGTARARSGRRPGRCRDSAWGIEDPECRPSRPRRGRSLRVSHEAQLKRCHRHPQREPPARAGGRGRSPKSPATGGR